MSEERACIRAFEEAEPERLAELLRHPSAEEERALRPHLGDERYERLHALALRQVRGAQRKSRGNVVVLHGFMGSELSFFQHGIGGDVLWPDALQIARGALLKLGVNHDRLSGSDRWDVRATGILTRHYGELLLSLSAEWTVRAFWYDWRKDLRVAADHLHAQVSGWFGPEEPVHLVAHSMGGLVARMFVARHPERWARMLDPDGRRGGRIVMLGTPNRGSFAILQMLVGIEPLIRRLALLDLQHRLEELLPVFASFPGLYQMLPSPKIAGAEPLYQPESYARVAVPAHLLEQARASHELLEPVVDGSRMISVAGHGYPTPAALAAPARMDDPQAYELTVDGDGQVPHALGLLDGVPAFYVPERHGDLPSHDRVLAALAELLETGNTTLLATTPPEHAAPRAERWESQEKADERLLHALVERSRRRAGPDLAAAAGPTERRIEDLVTSGFLSSGRRLRAPAPAPPPKLSIGLALAGIEQVADELPSVEESGLQPVDALAVGHYLGVRPQAAELALDHAVSAAVADAAGPRSIGLLTDYTERGVLRGELAQPFILPDPRDHRGTGRVIVVAGMGLPGRFGTPELTVLVRELCWTLSRLGKRHLAAVLIGSGNGNLPIADAVLAWLHGLAQGLAGAGPERRLERVTLVESDEDRFEDIRAVLNDARLRLQGVLRYPPLGEHDLWRSPEVSRLREADTREAARPEGKQGDRVPTRMTVELVGNTYRFGAITEGASIPERDVRIDPALVSQATDEVVAASGAERQYEYGRFLEGLLIPHDLRDRLAGDAPLVVSVDRTTARIPWEMVSQPQQAVLGGGVLHESLPSLEHRFLGTCRGLTRQLRTVFAPPPEPPPPPSRLLRVLIVADPAEDARLPGAEEEGVEVADLFEAFNLVNEGQTPHRVEVDRLIGPRLASRTNVLRHLMLRRYDVLHMAGHCLYDPADPAGSGWLFTGMTRIRAYELSRIDRVPAFVFSNACESGLTPEEPDRRTPDLAPSFAEAFFARGVANFVCTAWPVDDGAARVFARTFYASLLGLRVEGNRLQMGLTTPLPMYSAMQRARLAAAGSANGEQTWGAYQHYGNPFFQVFYPRAHGSRARC